jgi:hypothetical protein
MYHQQLAIKGTNSMDKLYPASLFAIAGLFAQELPKDVMSWESISFKVFLIIIVVALSSYQLYRDKCDRNIAAEHHRELRETLKEISGTLHNADVSHERLTKLAEQQLDDSRQIRNDNSEIYRRQWDLFMKRGGD